MKQRIRLQGQRSLAIVIGVFLILIVLVLIWTNQLLETATRDDPSQAPTLLILSVLFPVALLILSAWNFARVIAQRKAGVPGSRLRLRLIGAFTLAIGVAAAPIAVTATMFLRTAIGYWLAESNGQALEAGEDLARQYHSDTLSRLGGLAGSDYLSDLLSAGTDMTDTWAAVRDVAPWLQAMQVIDDSGETRMGEPSLFVSKVELDQFQFEGPLPRQIGSTGTLLSWQVYVGDRQVILSSTLPGSFESDARSIAVALDDWRRYDRLNRRIGGSLAVFGMYLSGPLILMALLIAMTLSERIIRPLVTLGEATRKISDGDFSFRVIAPREDELVFLTESFNRMIRELEMSRSKIVQSEKVAAWQTIAQRLAHELRNPLTPIKLSAQRVQRKALEDRLDNDTAGAAMSLILREVDGLDKLLQDFREFAGGSEPKMSQVSLGQLLQETVERFRTVKPEVEWTVTRTDTEATLLADELQVRQVLVNLLKNAMEAGAGTILCRIDPVHRGTTPYLRLQIRDNGEGIDAARSEAVFQPYDSTRDRGSGLGLAVVQRIIYDHQGRIWFESEKGTGTVFYIDLPVGEG